MSTIEEQIANNIKDIIKQSGKSVITLSNELQVPNRQIYSYINGEYLPGVIMLIKLCKALDCAFEDILGKID